MAPDLSAKKIERYTQWGHALGRVKNILLECRKGSEQDKAEILVEARQQMQIAIELSCEFPRNDLRRFLTLGTAIALYCHLQQYNYVELDRQIILRLSRRFPTPSVGDLLNSLGMLYQEHNKLDEAAQLYKRAVRLLPYSHPRFELLVSNIESLE